VEVLLFKEEEGARKGRELTKRNNVAFVPLGAAKKTRLPRVIPEDLRREGHGDLWGVPLSRDGGGWDVFLVYGLRGVGRGNSHFDPFAGRIWKKGTRMTRSQNLDEREGGEKWGTDPEVRWRNSWKKEKGGGCLVGLPGDKGAR